MEEQTRVLVIGVSYGRSQGCSIDPRLDASHAGASMPAFTKQNLCALETAEAAGLTASTSSGFEDVLGCSAQTYPVSKGFRQFLNARVPRRPPEEMINWSRDLKELFSAATPRHDPPWR